MMKTLPPVHKLVNLVNLMKICDPGDSPGPGFALDEHG
jgi:hypothetical protein